MATLQGVALLIATTGISQSCSRRLNILATLADIRNTWFIMQQFFFFFCKSFSLFLSQPRAKISSHTTCSLAKWMIDSLPRMRRVNRARVATVGLNAFIEHSNMRTRQQHRPVSALTMLSHALRWQSLSKWNEKLRSFPECGRHTIFILCAHMNGMSSIHKLFRQS